MSGSKVIHMGLMVSVKMCTLLRWQTHIWLQFFNWSTLHLFSEEPKIICTIAQLSNYTVQSIRMILMKPHNIMSLSLEKSTFKALLFFYLLAFLLHCNLWLCHMRFYSYFCITGFKKLCCIRFVRDQLLEIISLIRLCINWYF